MGNCWATATADADASTFGRKATNFGLLDNVQRSAVSRSTRITLVGTPVGVGSDSTGSMTAGSVTQAVSAKATAMIAAAPADA